MKLFPYLQSFGFTRNEIKVVLLLSATFLLGVAIRHFDSPSETTTVSGFDYSVADSIFKQRSTPPAESSSTAATGSPGLTPASAESSKLPPGDPVNINTATADVLIQLPGIGPAYAERIISYRKENGPFTSVDELENVKGIGQKRLERLRPFVRVR